MSILYIYYCVKHGDCFLKQSLGEPNINNSTCCSDPQVSKTCYYDYLGYVKLNDNKYQLFDTNKAILKKQFEDYNDGYQFKYFEKLIFNKKDYIN